MYTGRNKSVSRVAGAPPRTSTPPTATVSQRMTVQPVPASRLVSWPTRILGISVMSSCMVEVYSLGTSDNSLQTSSQPLHRLCHALFLVIDSRTGHEQISPGLHDLPYGGLVDAAIDLYIAA